MSKFTYGKFVFAAAILPAIALSGCVVSESAYDKVVQQNNELQASNTDLQTKNEQLQNQLNSTQGQVSRLQNAVKYSVNSDLLFAPGSWTLSPKADEPLAKIANILAPQQVSKVVVNGYTDNAPIGAGLKRQGVESNLELSQKRAEAVMGFLISHGVRSDMISAVGHGEQDPIASNKTAQGRAKNRRVEITKGE